MIEQVPRYFGRLALCQIERACHKLMPISQDPASNEGRVLELWVDTEGQINALGDLIDNPIGDENLYADVRVGRLECAEQRREQRVRDAGWRGKPQYTRDIRQMI